MHDVPTLRPARPPPNSGPLFQPFYHNFWHCFIFFFLKIFLTGVNWRGVTLRGEGTSRNRRHARRSVTVTVNRAQPFAATQTQRSPHPLHSPPLASLVDPSRLRHRHRHRRDIVLFFWENFKSFVLGWEMDHCYLFMTIQLLLNFITR